MGLFVCRVETRNEAKDIDQIINILNDQQRSWSNGDIEGFISGYWESASLKFYSGAKLSMGWQTTLDNYNLRYPSKPHTEKLQFEIANISKINRDAY